MKADRKSEEQAPKRKRASPRVPGWSANQFAHEVGASPVVIRDLVKAKQIETVDVAGRKRIPPRAKDRYLGTWGKTA